MKKFLFAALAVLFSTSLVVAQQLPSPSYRGLTLSGPYKVTHPGSATGDLLGPDGLNIIPFGSYRGLSYLHSSPGTHASNGLAGFTSAVTANGSGTFGPSAADVAGIFSTTKNSYLSSSVEGEMLGIYGIVNQGQKGDAAVLLGSTEKVRAGAGDTGGALGYELRAAAVNPSNTVLNAVHAYSPYIAPTSDMGGGGGYGSYVESFNGTNFSAFQSGALLTGDPATGWQNVITATSDRTAANIYFRVRGNKVTGVEQPGDIVTGTSTNKKTIRNNLGFLQVRNDADNATLLEVSDAGAVDFPSDPAWATYTPTLSCGTGTLTSASASGRFKGLGKTVHVRIAITITTLGTCASSLNFTLPANVAFANIFYGRSSVTPRMLMGSSSGTGTATVFMTDYNNGFPFASGDTVIINGTYEKQ